MTFRTILSPFLTLLGGTRQMSAKNREEKTPLWDVLSDEIQKQGPITIERYMEIVLHHPEHGYYRCGNPLGSAGDFGTAPEVSQLFGEMLGVWCIKAWKQLGEPDCFALLELGPGQGLMLQDIFSFTSNFPDFQRALHLYLLESSATLRGIQQTKMGAFAPTYIEFFEQLPALPTIVLANEFFDTLPMRQFIKTELGWRERLVGIENDKFVFTLGEEKGATAPDYLKEGEEALKAGWIYETSPQSLSLMQRLAAHLTKHGGAAAIIDYGYTVPEGISTLDAWSRHRFTDVLAAPGKVDVTADVDFSALRCISEQQGARVIGVIDQGDFLNDLGIKDRARALINRVSRKKADRIMSDLHCLTSPSQMGTRFKILVLASKKEA